MFTAKAARHTAAVVGMFAVTFFAAAALGAGGHGGGGGGGGGHGFSGGGGGGHSFSGGGMSHSLSSGGMSHSFSGGGISHSLSGGGSSRSLGGLSGGASHSFSPGSSTHFSPNASGLSSRGLDSRSFSSSQMNSIFGNSRSTTSLSHSFNKNEFGNSSHWGSNVHSQNWNNSLNHWHQGENNWASKNGNGKNWNDGHWHDNNWHNGNWHDNHWHDWYSHNGNWWWHNNWWSYYPGIVLAGTYWFPSWSYYDYYPVNDGSAPYLQGSPYYVYYQDQPQTQSQYSEPAQLGGPQPQDALPSGGEYYAQAEEAFRGGRYREALKLANHAAVESPQNSKAHELMSLSMFAAGDYRGAAIEAHAALALGPAASWDSLYQYYGDDSTYTKQLRSLEKYSHDNPKAADARFLRGYHYLMTGYQTAAMDELKRAVELTPGDRLASELLKNNGQLPAGGPAEEKSVPLPPPINPPSVKPDAESGAKPDASTETPAKAIGVET